MKLYVEPMDVVVVGVDEEGRLRYENDESASSTPTLQERRAVIYAARRELAELNELVEILEKARETGDP
jgi:hypothetical protein